MVYTVQFPIAAFVAPDPLDDIILAKSPDYFFYRSLGKTQTVGNLLS